MKAVANYKHFKPLFLTEHGLILAKRDDVYLMKADEKPELLFSLPNSTRNRLLDRFSLFFRLRRAGIYSAIGCANEFFFAHNSMLYHYDYVMKKLTEHKRFERGRGPLQFTVIENVKGFDDCVCYGEYFENPTFDEVYVYQYIGGIQWQVVHTFARGTINHIHGLIPDPLNQCVWILTGDFDDAAAIWRATDNFSSVEKIVAGQQHFRACVAFAQPGALLYATDTQLEGNSIRRLEQSGGQWVSKELMAINGSSIYGCELKDYYVFSTSTEPGEEKPNWLLNLIDNKPGPGIVKNASDIVLCDKQTLQCKVVKTLAKDCYPYRLFQFGAIMFPKGRNNSNRLYAYSVANKESDLCTEVYEIDSPSVQVDKS